MMMTAKQVLNKLDKKAVPIDVVKIANDFGITVYASDLNSKLSSYIERDSVGNVSIYVNNKTCRNTAKVYYCT